MRVKKNAALLLLTAISLSGTCAQAAPVKVQILNAIVKDQKEADATVILQKNGAQSVTKATDATGGAALATEFEDTDASLVIVKKPGYSNLVAKCPCNGMTYAISPVMTNLDGLRVVLNWGAAPKDLDSHMVYPNNNVFWDRKEGTDANLDVDDVDSFGPETITIEKKHPGETYVYAVHDYTNGSNPTAKALSNSGAKVLVYIGQSLVRSYYVPKNAVGNLWTVFRITPEGEFQDINTMKGVSVDAEHVLDSVGTYMSEATQVTAHAVSGTDSGTAKTLNHSGEAAYHAGNLDDAIELYRQAIELNPNYGQAYSNLGLAYQKAGRTAEAIWANRKGIALASGASAATTRANSYYNIAKIYEQAGQFADAKAQYEAAKHEKANPVYDKAIERVSAQIK